MFVQGQIYHRQKELHDKFGGNRQSGIASCAMYPYVFLFSSPRGEEFGYIDGWASDQIYQYTGEGQLGDMSLSRGNQIIAEHQSRGKELHLFKKVDSGNYEYLGKFAYLNYKRETGKDASGDERDILVFQLQKID